MLYMNNHTDGTIAGAVNCEQLPAAGSFVPSAEMQQYTAVVANEMDQLSPDQQLQYLQYVQCMQQMQQYQNTTDTSMQGMQNGALNIANAMTPNIANTASASTSAVSLPPAQSLQFAEQQMQQWNQLNLQQQQQQQQHLQQYPYYNDLQSQSLQYPTVNIQSLHSLDAQKANQTTTTTAAGTGGGGTATAVTASQTPSIFPTLHNFTSERSYTANNDYRSRTASPATNMNTTMLHYVHEVNVISNLNQTNQDRMESNQHPVVQQTTRKSQTGENELSTEVSTKRALSVNASEWIQTEPLSTNELNPLRALVAVQKANHKRRLKPTKGPRTEPEPLVMPRANEVTTYFAPTHCVIFDREGYKQFALENTSDDDHCRHVHGHNLNCNGDPHPEPEPEAVVNSENESPSSNHTLNGDAAEFVPTTELKVNTNPMTAVTAVTTTTIDTVEPCGPSLGEMVQSLLDDALSNGELAQSMEETVTSLICSERMTDGDYFAALFEAVMRGNTLRRVMTHELGSIVTAALFSACNEAQKVALIQTLSPGDNILYVACNEHGSQSLMAMVPTLSTTEQIGYFIEALIRNMATLGTDYYGVRLLNAYFEQGAVEGMMDMVFSIVEHIDVMARNEYGWYCYYHLLRSAAPSSITDQIKKALYNKYAEFCKGEYSAKVAEQCLRHSLADDEAERDTKGWAIVIMADILRESESLVANEYGKHVFHLALLSKVKGEIGGLSDELQALKEAANEIYQRHVQRKRADKRAAVQSDVLKVDKEETVSKVEEDIDGELELDVMVQSAVEEVDGDHLLQYVEFGGFIDGDDEAEAEQN